LLFGETIKVVEFVGLKSVLSNFPSEMFQKLISCGSAEINCVALLKRERVVTPSGW